MTRYFEFEHPVSVGYGLGVREVVFDGKILWGHTGGMRGYGSYMFFDPATNVSIAMLNNQSNSPNGPLLRYELVNELLCEVFGSH